MLQDAKKSGGGGQGGSGGGEGGGGGSANGGIVEHNDKLVLIQQLRGMRVKADGAVKALGTEKNRHTRTLNLLRYATIDRDNARSGRDRARADLRRVETELRQVKSELRELWKAADDAFEAADGAIEAVAGGRQRKRAVEIKKEDGGGAAAASAKKARIPTGAAGGKGAAGGGGGGGGGGGECVPSYAVFLKWLDDNWKKEVVCKVPYTEGAQQNALWEFEIQDAIEAKWGRKISRHWINGAMKYHFDDYPVPVTSAVVYYDKNGRETHRVTKTYPGFKNYRLRFEPPAMPP